LGAELAQVFQAGDVLLLEGPLGAGKTCLTRGLARGLGADPAAVLSPTFALVREVSGGRLPLHHIDLYRLQGPAEALGLGLEELFDGDGLCVVEWPERLGPLSPAGAWHLGLSILADGSREARCQRP
jgi:tRNA threonylcarbamoyladenosine biosynthesis protein TsaE